MSNIITFENVRIYLDNNKTAWLNLEDVSKGLGFTQFKNNIEYIRWETVTRYLKDLHFSQQVGKETFIPENLFYRLAMKANNEVADKFQEKIANDILPSIRKNGGYIANQEDLDPEELVAKALVVAQRIIENQKNKLVEMQPKAEFYDQVAGSSDAIDIGTVAKVLNVRNIGRNKLFEILRNKEILMNNNQPYQKYIDLGYFRIIESKWTTPEGETHIGIKTLVYQKGLDFIRKILKSEHEH